jgi:hypothetical protein
MDWKGCYIREKRQNRSLHINLKLYLTHTNSLFCCYLTKSRTFIYGGDSFSVNPPRVASFYGEFIETLLSSGLVRGITNVSSGFVKIALEPPVSVDSVSAAACNAATGKIDTDVLDTYDKIKNASEA